MNKFFLFSVALIKTLKALNRKRNYKTKKLKLIIKTRCNDSLLRKKSQISSENYNRILVVIIGRGIGDALVMSGLMKILSDNGKKVSVVAEKRISHIFSTLPFIHNIHLYSAPEKKRLYTQLYDQHYDLLIDIDDVDALSPQRVSLIKHSGVKHALGFNQFARVYDTTIKYDDKLSHISKRHNTVAKLLNLNYDDYQYHYIIPEKYTTETLKFITPHLRKKLVVLNPFTTEKNRDLSAVQIEAMTHHFAQKDDTLLLIIGEQKKINTISGSDNILLLTLSSFSHAAFAVSIADLVISPDTSIVHLAKVYNRRLICFYNNKISPAGEVINSVWGPDYGNAVQILSPGAEIKNIPTADILHIIEHEQYSGQADFVLSQDSKQACHAGPGPQSCG